MAGAGRDGQRDGVEGATEVAAYMLTFEDHNGEVLGVKRYADGSAWVAIAGSLVKVQLTPGQVKALMKLLGGALG